MRGGSPGDLHPSRPKSGPAGDPGPAPLSRIPSRA